MPRNAEPGSAAIRRALLVVAILASSLGVASLGLVAGPEPVIAAPPSTPPRSTPARTAAPASSSTPVPASPAASSVDPGLPSGDPGASGSPDVSPSPSVEPAPSPTPTASPVPVATGPVDPGTQGDAPGPLVALLTGATVTGIGVFGLRRAARDQARDTGLKPGGLTAG